MASTVLLFLTAVALSASVLAAKEHDHEKHEKHDKHDKTDKHEHKDKQTCQEFTQGLTFNDSQALGTWQLLQYGWKPQTDGKDPKCVAFSLVTEQERKDISEKIGKYVENMNWDNLTLKMQIPCIEVHPNISRDYFLERLEGNGSYRTLQMPPTNVPVRLDLTRFNRYPMRLKVIEGQYLGMMDCHEKFVFLLAKKTPRDSDTEAKLLKLMQHYWPEEN